MNSGVRTPRHLSAGRPGQLVFITGTSTGVGKTILTALLLARLRARGVRAIACKPFSTGSRSDARLFYELMDREIPLDRVNPFHFRFPVAPWVAATKQRQRIRIMQVVEAVQSVRKECDLLLVEGAGGLLTPLGKSYSFHTLIERLTPGVIVASQNRLGVLNQVLLTTRALPGPSRVPISIVLGDAPGRDVSRRSNVPMLRTLLPRASVHQLPFLRGDLANPATIRRLALGLGVKLDGIIRSFQR